MFMILPAAASSATDGPAVNVAAAHQAQTAASTVKYVKNKHSGKCLTVYRASKADNAVVNQYKCVGAANQRWNFEWTGGLSYSLRNMNSQKCLTVHGGSKSKGATIDQYTCVGSANQKFYINIAKPWDTPLKAAHSMKCVDVQGARTADNGRVIQWSCNGRSNQEWSY
ncbi:RICIN domain-containing protein [Streptomyces sp. NPDC093260]|uniref:RICIN domain-containing protein n=1 Tax=Streptomyces sp. NPDC093260 TaxID=3155073 RepID=UPI00341A19BC